MHHGVVEAVAYQETLLIMALFGLAILAMVWVGFRRWLQHQERMDRLIADQSAERAAQHAAQIERVEARLNSIEQLLTRGGVKSAAQIDAPGMDPLPAPALKGSEVESDS